MSNIMLDVINNDIDQCWGHIKILDKKIMDLGTDTEYESLGQPIGTTMEYFLKNGAAHVLAIEIRPDSKNTLSLQYSNLTIKNMSIENNIDISILISEYNPDFIKCDINGLEIHLLNIDDSLFSKVEEYSIKTHSYELYRLTENKLIRCGYDICKRINLTHSPQHSSWHDHGNYKILHAKKNIYP